MKKLFILILTAACTFMFASGSFAEDRLSLTGEFRIMAWMQEGYTGRDAQSFNDNDELEYIQQRFRTMATVKIADDVKVVTRFDIGEGDWGEEYRGVIVRPSGGARNASKIDFDRAFVVIDKEMWSLTAGQQFIGLGILQVLDSQVVGLKGVLKFDPASVSLIYAKVDEGASLSDDGAPNEDLDLYAINVSMDFDNVACNLFAVTFNDDSPADDAPVAIGVHAKTSLGAINLTGEVAAWFGDTMKNGPKQDYDGVQVYVGADTNLSDALKVGAELFYAQGADSGDLQMTTFADFGDFDPLSINTDLKGFISPASLGSAGSIFDFTGDMAGVQGITIFADFACMEGMNIGGKIGYFQPEEDDNTNVDNALSLNAYISYMIATNSKLSLTYFYTAPENDIGPDPDEATALALTMKITF